MGEQQSEQVLIQVGEQRVNVNSGALGMMKGGIIGQLSMLDHAVHLSRGADLVVYNFRPLHQHAPCVAVCL